MAEARSPVNILADQRKERKDLLAKIQKMKHAVSKGDKKKKKEVTAEVAQLLNDLDLKHENELKDLKNVNLSEVGNTVNVIEESSCTANNSRSFINTSENDSLGSVKSEFVNEEIKMRKPETNLEDQIGCLKISEANQKLSKAQKRRNKKANLEQQRSKEIAEQEIINLTGMRNMEAEEIKKKLSSRNLIIHEIPSDGDCLYRAIEHQLSVLKLQVATVKSLRELTSAYLLSHREDYIPFLTCIEAGDSSSHEQYTKYCEDIVATSAWGGHVEIQALSHVLGYPIEVIQAEGPSIFAGNENSHPKLILSYHRHAYGLGEHYNSVVPLTLENVQSLKE